MLLDNYVGKMNGPLVPCQVVGPAPVHRLLPTPHYWTIRRRVWEGKWVTEALDVPTGSVRAPERQGVEN